MIEFHIREKKFPSIPLPPPFTLKLKATHGSISLENDIHFIFRDSREVRDEIIKGETPLGRILINHNVLRHIDLGALLRITAGPELAEHLQMPEGGVTYGRLATIFCNRQPAVDLLEVSTPLSVSE